MSKDFVIELNEILEGYVEKVDKTKDEVMNEVATEAVEKLRNSSPTRHGQYARGWTSKKDKAGYVVYNATNWQLTHLLENGHVSRNQYGTYGRVRAIKHIEPVEKWANSEIVERIERELG